MIAIIGVLAGTAGVQYSKFLDRARTARAIVELRGIASQLDPMGDDDAVLPDSLSALGIATVDPWGNPYQYLKIQGDLPPGMASRGSSLPHVSAPGNSAQSQASSSGEESGGDGGGGGAPAIAKARKDRFLVPINSDYDLYSVGPDGQSRPPLNAAASRDDIIRAADGAFYGLAEKF